MIIEVITSGFLFFSLLGVSMVGAAWQNTFCNVQIVGLPDLLKCDNMKDTLHLKPGNYVSMSIDPENDWLTIDALPVSGANVLEKYCNGNERFSSFNATTGIFECTQQFVTLMDNNVCNLTNEYCEIFNVPLAQDRTSLVTVQLMVSTDTINDAIRTSVRSIDSDLAGTCTHTIANGTNGVQNIITNVSTDSLDTQLSSWGVMPNVPTLITISCVVKTDSTISQSLIIEYNLSSSGLATIYKGSYFFVN